MSENRYELRKEIQRLKQIILSNEEKYLQRGNRVQELEAENKQLRNALEIGSDEGDQLSTTRLAFVEAEQKLEKMQKIINDHPKHGYASELINRLRKVLDR